jgi:hypothetical protein
MADIMACMLSSCIFKLSIVRAVGVLAAAGVAAAEVAATAAMGSTGEWWSSPVETAAE